jgi:hypothetical protein
VATASRVTTLTAYHGATLNIQDFFLSASLLTAPSMAANIPFLSPRTRFPTTTASRFEAVISAFPITYDWNRYSWSGIMLYDIDLQGRVRPILKSGLYEWLGYFATWYARCTTATSCTWTQLGTTFSVGGSTTTAPTSAAPWRYGVIRDPVAGTWTMTHTHPTFGVYTASAWSDASIAANAGFYWTNYLGSATYGVYNASNVRVGVFVESQSGNGNSWGLTVERATLTEVPSSVVTPRRFWGTSSGVDGIVAVGAADTVLDTSRYQWYTLPAASPFCPLSLSTAPCWLNSATQSVSLRTATIRSRLGHQFNIGAFVTWGGATGIPLTTAPSLQNGVPILEAKLNAAIPNNESSRISVHVTGFTDPFNWDRFSWSGIVLYDVDLQGRVRPLFKTGLYEYLGYLAAWVPTCSLTAPTSCSWLQIGASFSIGGSSTTAPTLAVPWIYSLDRDPIMESWQPRHTHPTFGTWTTATVFSESYLQSVMAAYWTNYVNHPSFNGPSGFSWANVKIGAFVEGQTGGPWPTTTMGLQISHWNVESTIESVIAANRVRESSVIVAASSAGGQCGYMIPTTTTVARTASCTGNACTVIASATNNGVPHTVSVTAVNAAAAKSAAVAAASQVTPVAQLPIAGAQLFLDANSMASFAGASLPACTLLPGSTCAPTIFWPEQASSYLFGQAATAGSRPTLKTWSPASPFQSLVFDGVDDRVQIDTTMLARDAELELMFPDQPNYVAGRDAETTWFMLYQPLEATVLTGTRTAFGKGLPAGAGGSSYIMYTQRATASPVGQSTLWDQHMGFAVSSSPAGVGTVIARRYRTSSNTFVPNPHAAAPTILTFTHYRNNTGGLSSRAYRMDACEGVQTGNFLTDRCSYGNGLSPADPWLAQTAHGTNIGRQAGLPAGTSSPGTNVVDFNLTGSPIEGRNFPRASGVFGVGTVFDAGQSPVASYFRGQMLALAMYRRALNQTERQTVQEFLLRRYNQLCPAIPTPAGATGGCPASASGFTCAVTCDAAATPPRARVGGSSLLTCLNGAWVGKMPVCAATCPPRSSPRDYERCTMTLGRYVFTDATAFPSPSALSAIPTLDSVMPISAPWSLLDSAWSVSTPAGYSNGLLVGRPVVRSGCSPTQTGPLLLSESAPTYLEKFIPGARMVVEAQFRLMADGSSAGVATRVSGTVASPNAYMVLVGRAAPGSNNVISLLKLTSGVTTTLTSTPLATATVPFWDLTGTASATPITLRVTTTSFSSTNPSQIIRVELVSSLATVLVFEFTDSLSPITIGGAGLHVASGSAGYEYLTVQGDCDSSGSLCNLNAGQGCSWTCGNGTVPGVGGVPWSGASYVETCSAAGTLPAAAQAFSCIPVPPVFSSSNFSIAEDAAVGTVLGTVVARPVNPRHVALFNIVPSANNSEAIIDKYGASQGTVADVFGVGSCSGEVVLNRGGTVSFDRGKRLYTLIFTACTNGHPLACTNATVTINVLNVPSAPFFLRDPDTNNDSPWIRSVPEGSAVGAALLDSAGSGAAAAVTATSPEGSPLAYDIVFGNSDGMFFIEPTTGVLRVAKTGINFEAAAQYGVVVQAQDTQFPTLTSTVQVQLNVLDRNDAPTAATPQYLSLVETDATADKIIGTVAFADEDVTDTWTAAWVGAPPTALYFNASGRQIDVFLSSALTYPPPETSPVSVWQSRTVREVFKGKIRVTDGAGASVTIDVEVGILASWTPGPDPVATSVILPSPLGLRTAGAETITVTGSNFNTIRTTYGSLINATLAAQQDDPYPGRAYNCTSCVVRDDSTITCTTPNGWGANLILQLTYGSTRRNMATTAPLFVSYRVPSVSSVGGRASFPTDLNLAIRDSLMTEGGETLLLTGADMGTQADAARVLSLEFGEPLNDGTGRLEYTATYTPCPAGSTYETWATPSNTAGVDGAGNSRACIKVPAGFGRELRYRIVVGNQASNVSVFSALFSGWFLSYRAPTLTRVWKPINVNGDPPVPWVNTTNAGIVSSTGGDLIYFSGANFGPSDRVPMVTFFQSAAIMENQGALIATAFNFTPALKPDGKPNCWKPAIATAHTLMACETPPGAGTTLRVRLQAGSQATSGSALMGFSYPAPNVTGVTGPGARGGDTAGQQAIVLSGLNFGPTAARWTRTITNAYAVTPGTQNPATFATLPVSVTYGPTTGQEYVATGCTVTSEAPSQLTCQSAAGVGRDFIYRVSIAGRVTTLPRVAGSGYAPPLLSSIARLPAEVAFDPELDAVPGPRDFRTSGGETLVINGKNFGPCPALAAVPCALPASFSAQYYVTLDDSTTQFPGVTLGDAAGQLWYNATGCVMTVQHTQITCQTALGAGTNAVVRVSIAGQSSVLPTTSYAPPAVTALALRAADAVTPVASASPDGGDVVVVTGSNFGPRPAATCVVVGAATRCRGMIQSVTFGPTGTEHVAADWNIPAAAATTHNTIHVFLPPGIGVGHKVVVTVADQPSAVSTATFSYSSPTITSMVPARGPTDPSFLKPTTVTVSGYFFGALSSATDITVMFGNPEDRTLTASVPIIRVTPDRNDPRQVAAYLAGAAPRLETVTFHAPAGLGADRAVRIALLDKNAGASAPVVSAPAFFSYDAPLIMAIVVEALQAYEDNNASLGFTPEYAAAVAGFPDPTAVRRLTLEGVNFGRDAFGDLTRSVDFADPLVANASDPATVWNPAAPATDFQLFSWSTGSVVVLTTLNAAWVRIRTVAQQFNPPVNPVTGFADPVFLPTSSAPFRFDDLSPAIGNLVGAVGPFPTSGGDIIAFTVRNLASAASGVSATVDGAPCQLVYSPSDAARGPGQPVPAGSVRADLIFNSNSGFPYFDTATPNADSTWTLYCRLPPGEGAAARLVIARDTTVSGELAISYMPPSIATIDVWDNATAAWMPVTLGSSAVVTVPTLGTRVRVTGTNFGLCPAVWAGFYLVSADAPGCAATRVVQAGSTGSHSSIELDIPEGEGAAMSFAIVAGGQSSTDAGQRIGFSYTAPAVTSVTPTGRTAGGDVIHVWGTNLGINPPTVLLGSFVCTGVMRAFDEEGHSHVWCTVPEGSGKALDVVVVVGGVPSAPAAGAFSYLPPVITSAIVYAVPAPGALPPPPVTFDFTDPNVTFATGPDVGGFRVALIGDNFGAPDFAQHCLFVAWRGRNPTRAFACDGVDAFVGEGEIPRLALDEFEPSPGVLPWSHTRVDFLFPPGIGLRDLVVFVNGQGPDAAPEFRYELPTIGNELDPSTGPTSGGRPLSLTGTGFGSPPLDTSDDNNKILAAAYPVATTRSSYLARPRAPQAALVIRFGRGCITNFRSAAGSIPASLATCERVLSFHTPTALEFLSAAGIGANRSVTVAVYDSRPSAADPLVLEPVVLESNAVMFSYLPPSVTSTTPRPLYVSDLEVYTFYVEGENFGRRSDMVAQGWTPAERAVNMTVGVVPAIRADRSEVSDDSNRKIDRLEIDVPALTVGYHNLSFIVAGQAGFASDAPTVKALLVGCQYGTRTTYQTDDFGPFGGFFGRPGETCAPCMSGAVCLGFDPSYGPQTGADPGEHMYPIPVRGFYNLNATDGTTTGMSDACPAEVRALFPDRDVCIVRCEPPEACLGANECAYGYASKAPMFRCASCATGFYKRATECVKCPDSPWALVIGFAMLVVFGGGAAYMLNRMNINIAYAAIAIDYFQVLAIFAMARVAWPPAILTLFHILSAFNLNIEIVAPECIVPDLSFQRKWSFVMALPVSLMILFGGVTLVAAGVKKFIKGQKVKASQLGGSMMSSILMVMYLLYIYLTRNILDVFNCRPTDPPDGYTYLTVVFERCGVSGGVQMTLLPAAVVAVIVYIIGYPAGVGWLLWKNRELVMEDQLLRAKGVGYDRLTNPHAYVFRKRWARLYYQFKPDTAMWVLAIIIRKFCIAATFILFNKQPSFQMAATFLVMFLAYSAQMRFMPYMSPSDFNDTLKDHERRSFSDPLHARLRATLSGINSRTRKSARRNVMTADGTIDTSALLGVLRGWLFNYNTVEQLMLFSAGVVSVMGLMFAAQALRKGINANSNDAVTAVVIAVVSLSIIYLFTVFVTEVVVLAGEANRRKSAAAAERVRAAKGKDGPGAPKRAAGEDAPKFDAGDVDSTTNPMFIGAKAAAGGDDPASPVGDAADASSVIENMREPPASRELWTLYKSMFEELATTVDTLRAQVDAAGPVFRGDADGGAAAASPRAGGARRGGGGDDDDGAASPAKPAGPKRTTAFSPTAVDASPGPASGDTRGLLGKGRAKA